MCDAIDGNAFYGLLPAFEKVWARKTEVAGIKASPPSTTTGGYMLDRTRAKLHAVSGMSTRTSAAVRALRRRRTRFGSDAPMFHFESAAPKLPPSPLSRAQLAAIRGEGAHRLPTLVH